jgi:hypothetical protein
MRQKLQHTEQACFALSQSKAVSFAVAPSVLLCFCSFQRKTKNQGANFYRPKGYSTTGENIMLR